MASVQLSQRLKSDIIRGFEVELGKAYRKSYNIQEPLDEVIKNLQESSMFLENLIAMEKEYQQLLPNLQQRYNIQNVGYYSSKLNDYILKPNDRIGIVCNPNRPLNHNFSILKEWEAPYVEQEYGGKNETGTNYESGDVAVLIKDIQYYYPLNLSLDYERGWSNKIYAPHSTNDGVLIISDPRLCKAFSPIGEIEDRIASETATFKESLNKKNTLKQFLDDWPAGKNLVPQDDLTRMTTVKKPVKTTKAVIDTIPDELKDSMNEVILSNKLLGD